jgi:hypothetical protein
VLLVWNRGGQAPEVLHEAKEPQQDAEQEQHAVVHLKDPLPAARQAAANTLGFRFFFGVVGDV